MRLSYLLTQNDRRPAIRGTIVRLRGITALPSDQWEICLAGASTSTLKYLRGEFPTTRIVQGSKLSAVSGRYVIPLGQDTFPADGLTITSMISHLDASAETGAIVGKTAGGASPPALPTLVKFGASALRKSLLERIGGLSPFHGPAADYDLTFRILSAGSRIDHRADIIFQSPASEQKAPGVREIADLLSIARLFLPDHLSRIYWKDWTTKYQALAADAGRKRDGHLAILLARLRSITQYIVAPPPASPEVIESIFGLRRHAAMIGDWARRGSVWRVTLADFSDNLWATYNACRSSGLQIRCIADNNKAFENLSYRDLPIVTAARAFEGGGIDGVILTGTDPSTIGANFKSVRNHFHGPILRLCQTPREATHAQAVAA